MVKVIFGTASLVLMLGIYAAGVGFGYVCGVHKGIVLAMEAPLERTVYVKALTKAEIKREILTGKHIPREMMKGAIRQVTGGAK